MVSSRLAGGCGLLLATGMLLTPLRAQLPLTQAQKDKIKQCLCPNQHWLPHCQKAWNKHCIPWGHYTELSVSQTVATLPGTTPTEVGKKDVDQKVALIRKSFVLSSPAVQVDHIRLDQVGLAIYDNGKVAFSGQLLNQGGKLKELLGNNVKVVLRAHAGQNNEGTPLVLPRSAGPVSGPMLWEKVIYDQWLTAQNPKTIAISMPADEILNHFSEITGFDVTVAYDKGR
jgi:hypothetical protein